MIAPQGLKIGENLVWNAKKPNTPPNRRGPEVFTWIIGAQLLEERLVNSKQATRHRRTPYGRREMFPPFFLPLRDLVPVKYQVPAEAADSHVSKNNNVSFFECLWDLEKKHVILWSIYFKLFIEKLFNTFLQIHSIRNWNVEKSLFELFC